MKSRRTYTKISRKQDGKTHKRTDTRDVTPHRPKAFLDNDTSNVTKKTLLNNDDKTIDMSQMRNVVEGVDQMPD